MVLASSCEHKSLGAIRTLEVSLVRSGICVGDRVQLEADAKVSVAGGSAGWSVSYEWSTSDPELLSRPEGAQAAVADAVSAGTAAASVTARLVDPSGRAVDSRTADSSFPVSYRTAPASRSEYASEALPATVRGEVVRWSDAEWSSTDPSVAAVDGRTGRITAVSSGTAELTVVWDGGRRSATFAVEVSVPVSGIALVRAPSRLAMGSSTIASASALPESATVRDLTWESDNPSAVSVSYEGDGSTAVLTANDEGSAAITVRSPSSGASESFEVSCVRTIRVEGVRLSRDSISVSAGSRVFLSAQVEPEDATDRRIEWRSSSPLVRIVSSGSDGCEAEVTGLLASPATITAAAASSDASASCEISTVDIAVTEVSLSARSLTLSGFEAVPLEAAALPEGASEPELSWSSQAPELVEVLPGSVRLLRMPREGEPNPVEITVSASSGVSASCLAYIEVPASSLALSEQALAMVPDTSRTLSASLVPANSTADPEVSWASSDESVATVSASGEVRAVAPGDAWITAALASDASVSAACQVSVTRITRVSLDRPALSILSGSGAVLFASTDAEPFSERTSAVAWSSSDPDVAVVLSAMSATSSAGDSSSSAGLEAVVRGVSPGSAVITATSVLDPALSASCVVTVTGMASMRMLPAAAVRVEPEGEIALS